MNAIPATIEVDGGRTVSGLWLRPDQPTECFVFAHGAGAGMAHPFMAAIADGLCQRNIATLRYQFPYMESGSRRPDRPETAHAAVRAAVAHAHRLAPDLPLIAGGKSFGARMTSQAQAELPLPNVVGLAFLGFPLHPAGKSSDDRAAHLSRVRVPMLFLQGTRDTLADQPRLQRVLDSLGAAASVHWLADADHSFHVPVKSGRTDTQVREDMLDALARWTSRLI
jgi:predicted alpha/beta-hydrolase family hydrolase